MNQALVNIKTKKLYLLTQFSVTVLIRSAGVLHMTQNDASGFLGLFVSNHSMNRSRLVQARYAHHLEVLEKYARLHSNGISFFLTKRRHRPAPMLISLSQNSSTYSQTHHHPKVSFFLLLQFLIPLQRCLQVLFF